VVGTKNRSIAPHDPGQKRGGTAWGKKEPGGGPRLGKQDARCGGDTGGDSLADGTGPLSTRGVEGERAGWGVNSS